MSTTIDVTVGDTAVTISGTMTQKALGGLPNTGSCTAKVSLIKQDGTRIVDEAPATIGLFDPTTSSVKLSYKLQQADVAAPALVKVRWVFILPDNTKIHAPGPHDGQMYLRINA
jgi:hypothetical protein